jgi:hypothetical protein
MSVAAAWWAAPDGCGAYGGVMLAHVSVPTANGGYSSGASFARLGSRSLRHPRAALGTRQHTDDHLDGHERDDLPQGDAQSTAIGLRAHPVP